MTSEPELEKERKGLTIGVEVEPQYESDQGSEPATPMAKGMKMENWLINFDGDLSAPTQYLNHYCLWRNLRTLIRQLSPCKDSMVNIMD